MNFTLCEKAGLVTQAQQHWAHFLLSCFLSPDEQCFRRPPSEASFGANKILLHLCVCYFFLLLKLPINFIKKNMWKLSTLGFLEIRKENPFYLFSLLRLVQQASLRKTTESAPKTALYHSWKFIVQAIIFSNLSKERVNFTLGANKESTYSPPWGHLCY